MQVREIITLAGWTAGSGWSYSTCYSDQVITIGDTIPATIDWDWWNTDGRGANEDGDTKITVRYYAPDADPDTDEPLATYSAWDNDLITGA